MPLPRRSPRKHPTDQASGSRSPLPTIPEYQPTDHAMDSGLNAACDQPQNIENEAGWVHKQVAAEWYRDNPRFYDKVLDEFKLKKENERLMNEFAESLGTTGTWLKKWYNSQRTTLGKLKLTSSGQAKKELTSNQLWVQRNFMFLWDHIRPKERSIRLGCGVSIFIRDYSVQ